MFEIEKNFQICEAVSAITNLKEVLYTVKVLGKSFTQVQPNILQQMMNRRHEILEPTKKKGKDGHEELHNHLIEYLKKKKAEFLVEDQMFMQVFFSIMVKALWIIDGQFSKFQNAPNVKPLPESFKFKPQQETFHRLNYDGHAKKLLPSMKNDALIDISSKLDDLLSKKKILQPSWQGVYDDVFALNDSIKSYIIYLTKKNEPTPGTSSSLTNNSKYYVIEAHKDIPIRKLNQKIIDACAIDYEPVNIAPFAPLERREKYRFIVNLKLPIAVTVYRVYKPAIATFLWKIPTDADDRIEANSIKAVHKVDNDLIYTANELKLSLVKNKFKNAQWSPSQIEECMDIICGK